MSATTDRVVRLIAPLLEQLDLDLYDLDNNGGTLRILLDRKGGADMDAITEATREISACLDREEPIAGSYTLEVSSPGVERPLRTAEHFAAAVGQPVKVKLRPGISGDRRAEGVVAAVDGDSVTIQTDSGERILLVDDISKAHTVFEWDSGKKSGSKSKSGKSKKSKTNKKTQKSMKPSPTAEDTTESNEVSP